MKVCLVKHKYKGRNYPEVVKVCMTAELAKKYIDKNKDNDKFNGLWFLSDRKVLEEV